jgi:hypothetical protein
LVGDSYEHPAKFPANDEINLELLVALSQARKIAAFAGIDSAFYSAPPLPLSAGIPNDEKVAKQR